MSAIRARCSHKVNTYQASHPTLTYRRGSGPPPQPLWRDPQSLRSPPLRAKRPTRSDLSDKHHANSRMAGGFCLMPTKCSSAFVGG